MTAVKSKPKSGSIKNRRKIIAKKIKSHKMGLIILLSLVVIVTLTSINIWNNLGKIKDRNERISEMQLDYNHKRIQNDALQQKVDAPVDDEYIADFARRNGYRKPDEIIFYLPDEK